MSVRKLYNPDANPNNLLVMHQTQADPTLSDAVANYTIDGTITAVTGVKVTINTIETEVLFTSVSTPKEIRMAIANALKGLGYDPYYDADNYKGIVVTGTRVSIVGEAPMVSLKINGSYVPFVVKNTPARVVKLTGVVTNNVAYTLSDGSNTDVITVTTIGALRTALNTFATDSSLGQYLPVDIVADGDTWVFTYHLLNTDGFNITGDATSLVRGGYYMGFK